MRILAIVTTERIGSLAALDSGVVLREAQLPTDMRMAQSLATSTGRLLDEVGWLATDLELLAVAIGPGAFTGLRIGAVFAKSLAYASGAEILGVGTLRIIAQGAPIAAEKIDVAIDAQRDQVFASCFAGHPSDPFRSEEPVQILDNREWLARLERGASASGTALRRLAPKVSEGVRIVEESCWSPRARALGELAWHDYQAGRRDDLWQLTPKYYRKSYAEEKRRITTEPLRTRSAINIKSQKTTLKQDPKSKFKNPKSVTVQPSEAEDLE